MSFVALRQIPAYCVTLICILGLAAPARAQVAEQDSLALVALYDSTNGPGWTTTWDLNSLVSSWHGVTVYGDRVIQLVFHPNNLSGPIPPEIGNLTSLKKLTLESNQLTGPVPPEIGSLTSLTALHLVNNQLTGPIPAEIGNLTSLSNLSLDSNQLTGPIPAEISNLTSLTYLSLNGNQLTGPIPAEIGSLTSLTGLHLGSNQLTGPIPAEIGNLTGLTFLRLYSNQLTGPIPAEIGNPTGLKYLYLYNNQLTGLIPAEIGSLTSLKYLYLNNNQLTGPIPAEIGSLTSLTDLRLGGNQLTGPIPPEIGSLTSLQNLYLYINQLTGPIPPEIGSLTSLTDLYLYDNQLTGPIPAEIGNLTILSQLYLNNNKFTDLPDLKTLSALLILHIQNNQLTFEDIEPNVGVPLSEFIYTPQDSVGTEQDTSVVEGTSLNLSIAVGGTANQYQWLKDGVDISGATKGTLIIAPVSLADSGLYILRTTNSIATALTLYSRPVHVSVLTAQQADSLALVTLYDSTGGPGWTTTWDLSSPVSTWHGVTVSGDRVTSLDLYNNNLTGPIPPEIRNLTSLTDLHLGINQLTGPIPAEIGSLTSLTGLVFNGNQLTGPLPAEIGNLTSLTDLHLGSNQLTGPIPPEIGSLTSLQTLYLYGNQLTGPTPPEIGSLTNLRRLRLSDNQLVDLPDLSSLFALYYLLIQNNRFTFEDIEPNVGVITYFTYSPQDSVGTKQDTTVDEGTSLTLSIAVGGTANQYQWLKDGIDIAGAVNDNLIIAPVSLADTGSYILRTTNSIAAALTLYSRPIHVRVEEAVAVHDGETSIPLAFALHPAYPNPFNPSTTLRFDLPEATEVYLVVCDLLGREVVRLVDGRREAGYHRVVWDGRDARGREVPTGLYIARMVTPGYIKSIKLVLMK